MDSIQEHISKAPEVGILFGERTQRVLGQAMCFIANRGARKHFDDLIKMCLQTSDVETIARIVTATAVSSPVDAHEWLRLVRKALPQIDQTAPGEHFQIGATLGLFEASEWFDKHDIRWSSEDNFPGNFPEFVQQIVLAQTSVPPSLMGDLYTGRMSSSIKAWARPVHRQGIRLIQVQAAIFKISEGINERLQDSDTLQLPVLSEFVLDQLTYAVFGIFAPYERSRGLASMFESIMKLVFDGAR